MSSPSSRSRTSSLKPGKLAPTTGVSFKADRIDVAKALPDARQDPDPARDFLLGSTAARVGSDPSRHCSPWRTGLVATVLAPREKRCLTEVLNPQAFATLGPESGLRGGQPNDGYLVRARLQKVTAAAPPRTTRTPAKRAPKELFGPGSGL